MKVKTSELTGAALDYAVAVCEGGTNFRYDAVATYWITINGKDRALAKGWSQSFIPSTSWEQGGPIIERELIGIDTKPCARAEKGDGEWIAYMDTDGDDMLQYDGPTPLIAAMRCYVASKLGEEIEIPEGLCQEYEILI